MKMRKSEVWKRIRVHCVECAGSMSGVRECEIFDCSLHPYRMGQLWAADRVSMGPGIDFGKRAIAKAIRRLCQYCLGQERPTCHSKMCQLKPILWPNEIPLCVS